MKTADRLAEIVFEKKEEFEKLYPKGVMSEVIHYMVIAYNLAIEDAANSAEAEVVWENDPVVGEYQDAVVNYESIIKLKI